MIWILKKICIYVVCYIVLCSITGSTIQLVWKQLLEKLENRGLIRICYDLMLLVIGFYLIPVVIIGSFQLEDYVIFAVTDAISYTAIGLSIVWFIGAFYQCKCYVRERKKIKRLRSTVFSCEVNYQKQMEIYKNEIGIRQKVGLCYHFAIPVPIVCGILRPVIILPERVYTEQELGIILKHELMHIKHHDLLWKQLCQFIQILHWWNPIARRFFAFMDEWTEAYCDFSVCNSFYSKKEYFSVIMRIGTADFSFGNYLCAALCENENGLKKRILRMKKIGHMNGIKLLTAICVCGCFLIISVTTVYATTVGFGTLYMYTVWETAEYTEEGCYYIPIEYKEMKTDQREEKPQKIQRLEIENKQNAYIFFDEDVAANSRAISKKIKLEKGKTVRLGNLYGMPVSEKEKEQDSWEVDPIDEKEKDYLVIGLIDEDGKEQYATSAIEINCKTEIEKDGYYRIFIDNLSKEEVNAFGTMDDREDEE